MSRAVKHLWSVSAVSDTLCDKLVVYGDRKDAVPLEKCRTAGFKRVGRGREMRESSVQRPCD